MRDFLNLKPEAFGIDISTSSIKIVKLKKNGKFFSLASFGETPIKPGTIREGEIKDQKSLAESIESALAKVKGEKLKTKYVIASLPEEKTFLQIIKLPNMPEEDLKSAVVYEAENYIPLPIEEVYLDFQIVQFLPGQKDHLDVLITASPKKIVDDYLKCLKSAGLKPKALEVESLAISRAVIKNELSQFPILIIDLGSLETSFIIFNGDSLLFTSSINVSSDNFDKNNLVNRGQKFFFGKDPDQTFLLEKIKKHIEYYKGHSFCEQFSPENKAVKKILLCGEGANTAGLADFFSAKLSIPVERANPLINILENPEKEIPQFSLEQSLAYTTALGLALRGVKEL